MNDSAIPHVVPNGRWLQPLHDWPSQVLQQLSVTSHVARMVVATVRGSAPREVGACMLIGAHECSGTIGGGQLEWVAIEAARQLLADPGSASVRLHRFVLATDLAQCCGGVVEIWIERYTRVDRELLERIASAPGTSRLVTSLTNTHVQRTLEDNAPARNDRVRLTRNGDAIVLEESLDEPLPSLYLYGAGHVGQALARVLANLPLQTCWIDSRAEFLPPNIGGSVQVVHATEPLLTLANAPAQTHFIVMTHSHSLDYALCRMILQRGEFASVGVIGSHSKAARFRSRLARDGMTAAQIALLQCPLGIGGLRSKRPEVIAVAIAAKLLQDVEARELSKRSAPVATLPGCDASPAGCAACGVAPAASLKAS